MTVPNRDLNLILAALFELRLTCLENERTWTEIGNVAELLGGDRTAMYFGAPAPDRGPRNRPCVTLDDIANESDYQGS